MVNPTDYIEFAQKVCLDAIAVGAGSGGMDRGGIGEKALVMVQRIIQVEILKTGGF